MSTCWEHIRKNTPEDKKMFNRLQNYFKAVDNNETKKYHRDHGRE